MINPEVVSQTTEAVGALLPGFALGAAIFRIRQYASKMPKVRTLEPGRKSAIARTESDPETADTYVGIPTGARVRMILRGRLTLDTVDLRKKKSQPDQTPKLLIATGTWRRNVTNVVGLIEDHEIQGVDTVPGVSVRYLGSVDNEVLRGNLKELFERGTEQAAEE